jgi:hypothetical protein
METGKPIWVESLLTKEEWKQSKQKYPSSFNLPEPPAEYDCDFKWRKGMGVFLTKEEINRINMRIDIMIEKAKIKLNEEQIQ